MTFRKALKRKEKGIARIRFRRLTRKEAEEIVHFYGVCNFLTFLPENTSINFGIYHDIHPVFFISVPWFLFITSLTNIPEKEKLMF